MDENLVQTSGWLKQKNSFLPPRAGYCFKQKLFWEDGRKSIHDFSAWGRQMQLKKEILSLQLVKYWGKRFPNFKKKKVQKNSFASFDLKPQQIIQNSQSKAQLRGREGEWGDRKQEVGCITCLWGIGHCQLYIVWVNPHINLQIRGVDYTHFSAKDTKDL